MLVDSYADQIYLFQDRRVELIKDKGEKKKIPIEKTEYRLDKKNLILSFLSSKLFSGFFHLLCSLFPSFLAALLWQTILISI